MFQSRRIASGISFTQASSAWRPSAASTMVKPKPSRIRLATFRMTLESSITKQRFMVLLLHSGGSFARLDLQHAVDIKNNHQVFFEPVDAGGDAAPARVEVHRNGLQLRRGKLHHFAHLVDQEPVGFPAELDSDRHLVRDVVFRGEVEASAHVDHGHDAAAQIENPRDLVAGHRYARHAVGREHVMHSVDRKPEQLIADRHRHEFDFACLFHHAALLISCGTCLSAVSSPWRSNLATKLWKPDLRPRSTTAAEECDDSAMIGMSAKRAFLRSVSANSKPLMPGISMSLTTASKEPSRSTISSASAPLVAVVTS